MNSYFDEITKAVEKEFKLAKDARKNGAEISKAPEIYIAKDLADKVEGLVEIKGLAETIRKLKKEYTSEEEIAFKITENIISNEKDPEKSADKALRAALAFLTQGAVAAPLEGIAKVNIKGNPDGSKYLTVYYAGPIRAAGGTAEAFSVVVADYIRKILGLDHYKPTLNEIGRYFEELQWYHRYVHLQYMPTEEETKTIVQNLPVCIDGEPTEEIEVSHYRDLGRVETNRIRGGMCLVLAEGIAQKAQKLLKKLRPIEKKFNIDWSWLEGLIVKKATEESPELKEKLESLMIPRFEWVSNVSDETASELGKMVEITKEQGGFNWLEEIFEEPEEKLETKKYLKEIPAGRPIFSYPSKVGGFSLRYGRTRASGYAAVAINPATMILLDDFIAIGTQIRLELPEKAAIVTPCEEINGPTVRLKNKDVLQINSVEEAKKLKDEVEKILYLGDILISVGDFLENNHTIVPCTYCKEWWAQELKSKLPQNEVKPLAKFINKPYETPTFKTAVEISKKYQVPLHPKYTFYWNHLTLKDLKKLFNYFKNVKNNTIKGDLQLKRILEKLGATHKVRNNKIHLQESLNPILLSLGVKNKKTKAEFDKIIGKTKNVLETVNKLSGIKIKPKIQTTIGARMGRPEKAKPRKMVPAPHVLFPTGAVKGRIRNIVKVASTSKIETIKLAKFRCKNCGGVGPFPKCMNCASRTELLKFCVNCNRATLNNICPNCGAITKSGEKRAVNIEKLLEKASKNLGEKIPDEIKGVIGMISKDKIPEKLEKGILRAKHNVYTFKDGTIRFDSTNAPLTHFKAKELGTTVKKLKELGYTHDIHGKKLRDENQILELKPQDVVLSEYGEDSAASYLLRATKFVDDLLEKYYKLKPYYNTKVKEDLIGKLIIALAPHTSTGIVGRIIGFTKARVGFAHPCFHDATRRDCDGDENATLLLLDALLNFSRAFLPDKRGGRMDAPLVISTKLNPLEIDEEVYDVDIGFEYPLEFYEAAEKFTDPSKISIKTIGDVVHNKEPFKNWGFTHDTENINNGTLVNIYTEGGMLDKLHKQLNLAEKISAVDEKDVAERIINSHFLPDIKGNLRTFSRQKIRCTKCNAKYRRPPLIGSCTHCGGKLTFTVHRGTIEKYLNISKQLVKTYKISPYISQQIELLDKSIESIFGPKEQSTLDTFK